MKFQDGKSFEIENRIRRRRHRRRSDGVSARLAPRVLEDFLDAIEHNREPRISGAEALKVHRFIDRILQSAG